MKNLILKIGLIVFIVLLILVTEIKMFKGTRPSHVQQEKIIYIKPNSSFKSISRTLEKEGVITNAGYFDLYARWNKATKKIKSGELRFYTNSKPKEVLNILVQGHPVLYPITIPEGYNMYQIANKLQELKLLNKEDFLQSCRDAHFLEKFKIKTPTCEGFLYPNTYHFSKFLDEEKIISEMIQKFKNVYSEEFEKQAQARQMTMKEVITLASIVEKETGVAHERPLIASVFHNRLKKGMKLQSDPTTIYGIWESYKGNITKKNLEERTAYNTYSFYGLPLGPIANPGIESIKAVLYPPQTSYLYFVSKNDGTHYFSKNLIEHNKAVQKYQLKK